MENQMKTPKIYTGDILDDYALNSSKLYELETLMIFRKNGRKHAPGNSSIVYSLLHQKLLDYGILLLPFIFEYNNIHYRAIRLAPDFPVENEVIISALYGNSSEKIIPITLDACDEYSLCFYYNTFTGEGELKRLSFTICTNSRLYDSLGSLLKEINEIGLKNIL